MSKHEKWVAFGDSHGSHVDKNALKALVKFIKEYKPKYNADFVDGAFDPTANATEAAMDKLSAGHLSAQYRMNIPKYRKKHQKLHEIPLVHELPQDLLLETEEKLEDADDEDAAAGCPSALAAAQHRHVQLPAAPAAGDIIGVQRVTIFSIRTALHGLKRNGGINRVFFLALLSQ